MNSTKKVLKGGLAAKKQPQKKQQENGKKLKIWAGVLAAFLVIVSIAIAWENLHPKLILTVNGQKTYLEGMTYQIMQAEQSHNSIASLYQQMGYTTNYWDMEEEGVTTQERVREQIIQAEIQQQLLYAEASKEGYEVTDAEKEEAATAAKTQMESMSDEQKKKTGFTESKLTDILTQYALTRRYKQDMIDSFDIDDEALRAGVDREQYRQYNTQCFFVSTEVGEGEEPLADAQKEERKAALLEVAEGAKGTEDWSTVLNSEDEGQIVSYQAINFIKEDTNYDAKVMEQAMKMENGTISDVVEGATGYYIIKMVNNNSDERYETEVSNAITTEENQRFDEKYLSIYESYEIKINQKEWEKVTLGSMTM